MAGKKTQTPSDATAGGLFFGWKVVAAAFTITFLSAGLNVHGLSVFLQVLHAERGWPISLISSAITAHFLVSALTVTGLADAYRRFGVATITRAGVMSTALGVIGWAVAARPWGLFGAAVLTGVGWATASAAAINSMVAPWFNRRRPTALGHALNGISVAGIVFVPLWIGLINHVGLAVGAAAMGATTLVVTWRLSGQFLHLTPAALGLAPDGHRLPPTTDAPPVIRSAAAAGAVVANRRFVTLSAAFALGNFAQMGLLAHLLARLVPILGTDGAAAAVSLSAICAVAGQLLLAHFVGAVDPRVVAAGNFTMQAFGVTLLAFGSNGAILSAGAILFGLGLGNLVLLPPLIVQAEFEAADAARVAGLVIAVSQATFAFGPACIGVLRDLSGGYSVAFFSAVLMQVVSAMTVLIGRGKPRAWGAA